MIARGLEQSGGHGATTLIELLASDYATTDTKSTGTGSADRDPGSGRTATSPPCRCSRRTASTSCRARRRSTKARSTVQATRSISTGRRGKSVLLRTSAPMSSGTRPPPRWLATRRTVAPAGKSTCTDHGRRHRGGVDAAERRGRSALGRVDWTCRPPARWRRRRRTARPARSPSTAAQSVPTRLPPSIPETTSTRGAKDRPPLTVAEPPAGDGGDSGGKGGSGKGGGGKGEDNRLPSPSCRRNTRRSRPRNGKRSSPSLPTRQTCASNASWTGSRSRAVPRRSKEGQAREAQVPSPGGRQQGPGRTPRRSSSNGK